MNQINNLDKWMKGKTVKSVDSTACNCIFMFFTDDTILCIETENVGVMYGPVPYEVTKEYYINVVQSTKVRG